MRMILITFLLSLSLNALAPVSGLVTIERLEPLNPYLSLFNAVCEVETGCRAVINIEEGSYGVAQITQAKLDDFNKANHKNYTLNDCLLVSVSKEVFFWHIRQYKDIDLSVRRWNGSGKATFEYLRKVKHCITFCIRPVKYARDELSRYTTV